MICAAWALVTAACSGDDAAPSTTIGSAGVTTIPATTTSATTSTTASVATSTPKTPSTTTTDEAAGFNSGPSAAVDEHTERTTEVIAEMRTTMDVDRLRPLIAEAEEILADQVVFIPLYTWPA